ncbi:transcriptional regulator ChbR [Enterobacteriaceae bacterium 155047]|uniref:transcriptional regulator ChbR n=1 Tax=Huaxiibacter chinensis TaxID=2899785 RepID=UPI0007DA688C|nr:transcriptional regulator ChbR [Huaxiibacter chinensis]ANG92094.1 transcriptional regulator ChbR [Lelliottia amnigena]MCG5043098.1 transcriptional regulator ChbR [Huaxiibacter chinensis]
MECHTVQESQFLKGKDFYFFILDKTESRSGLHEHDYYEFTLILNGICSQIINGKRVDLARGDFVFIPVGSNHQTYYDYGVTRILNMGIGKRYFDQHYLSLLPSCFVASQRYSVTGSFLNYIESTLATLNAYPGEFDEFNKLLTYYIVNRLCHYDNAQEQSEVPGWLTLLVRQMHNKALFAEKALENMVRLSGKTQSYLTRATNRYYQKTPGQLINEIRINYARQQLETTNFSVTDIAFDAGFSSPGLFINHFKKITSVTPGHYRRRLVNQIL